MTGTWERRLDNLAHGGRDWAMPSHEELTASLSTLSRTLKTAASEPGITGEAGDAATVGLDGAASRAAAIIETAEAIRVAVDRANVVRSDAQRTLSELPSGELSWSEQALIGAAAVGSTIVLGPFAIVAGVAALQNAGSAKAAMREKVAQDAVDAADRQFRSIPLPVEIFVEVDVRDDAPPPPPGPVTRAKPYTLQDGSGDDGFSSYPDFDVDPLAQVAVQPGVTYNPGGVIAPPGSVIVPVEFGPWPQGPVNSGSSTVPDVGSGGASGTGVAGTGSSGGLLGGASNALVAGAGGAALLGAGSRFAGGGALGATAGNTARAVPAAGGLTGNGGVASPGARGPAPAAARPGVGGLLGGNSRPVATGAGAGGHAGGRGTGVNGGARSGIAAGQVVPGSTAAGGRGTAPGTAGRAAGIGSTPRGAGTATGSSTPRGIGSDAAAVGRGGATGSGATGQAGGTRGSTGSTGRNAGAGMNSRNASEGTNGRAAGAAGRGPGIVANGAGAPAHANGRGAATAGHGTRGAAGSFSNGTRGGAAPTGASAAGRSATGAGSGNIVPGGRPSDKPEERTLRRGLGGAIAPTFEEDAELGPRSESAMAGGRLLDAPTDGATDTTEEDA